MPSQEFSPDLSTDFRPGFVRQEFPSFVHANNRTWSLPSTRSRVAGTSEPLDHDHGPHGPMASQPTLKKRSASWIRKRLAQWTSEA